MCWRNADLESILDSQFYWFGIIDIWYVVLTNFTSIRWLFRSVAIEGHNQKPTPQGGGLREYIQEVTVKLKILQ